MIVSGFAPRGEIHPVVAIGASPGGYEVDFYLPEKGQLIQVTQQLNQPAVREREIRALREAAGIIKAKSALILTDDNPDAFEIDNRRVEVRSAAEWLLEEEIDPNRNVSMI